jgi:hypothetical protein
VAAALLDKGYCKSNQAGAKIFVSRFADASISTVSGLFTLVSQEMGEI